MKHAIADVIRCGAGLSFQGKPRHGLRRYGVAPSGPLDPAAAQLANHLLDQAPHCTVIEIALGGTLIELRASSWIAHVGGLQCDTLPAGSARRLSEGERLLFTPGSGALSYIAIPGGWLCKTALGSSSFHARSNLGEKIKNGSTLSARETIEPYPGVSKRNIHLLPDSPICRLYPGPHTQLFPDADSIVKEPFTISSQSDRTGYRLEESISPLIVPDLKSLPTLPGCIQVTPSGQPIVTLHDGPTVGGYPIIAIIDPDDLRHLVQTPPGKQISFTWHETTPPEL